MLRYLHAMGGAIGAVVAIIAVAFFTDATIPVPLGAAKIVTPVVMPGDILAIDFTSPADVTRRGCRTKDFQLSVIDGSGYISEVSTTHLQISFQSLRSIRLGVPVSKAAGPGQASLRLSARMACPVLLWTTEHDAEPVLLNFAIMEAMS
jgi:hypothetical protein